MEDAFTTPQAAQDGESLQQALQSALLNGEFFICMQPKYALPERRIAGAEALLRWNDPARGIRFPAEFLSAADRYGYMETLDLLALEQACRCIRGWIDSGLTAVPVSVNLSRASLYAKSFPDAAADCLQRYRIPPFFIEFEFSAQMIEQHPVALYRAIKQFHALDCHCALDGFVQPPAMLEHILAFEIDTVKCNCKNLSRHKDLSVCLDTLEAARRLKLNMLCECVKNGEHLDALASAGCRLAQGYALSTPVSTQLFSKMLKSMTA